MSEANPNELIVEPGQGTRQYWNDLWRYRELFYYLAWRDILVRYKQTVIGISWSVLRPLLTMIILTVVFGYIAGMAATANLGPAEYGIMVMCGMLPWQFFSGSLTASGQSLVNNASMVSKVYFPRLILPASSIITTLVDLLIAGFLLAILMVIAGVVPSWQVLLLPLFIALAFVASFGAGIWLAALMVRYRDFRIIVPFIVQFGFFLSPVGYESSTVNQDWRFLYSLNPMVGVIDGFRWAILGGEHELYLPGIAISIVLNQKNEGLRHVLQRGLTKPVRWAKNGFRSTSTTLEEFWAIKDISFSVQPGEVVGVIGRNGAGKSTLLKVLSRITEQTQGRIHMRGRTASLLEVGTGFHPELTGRENIYLNGAILGMGRSEIKRKFDEIVDFSEVEKFLDTPVKRYSSGMYVRLAFGVAAHLDPEILIIDEVLAVGDAEFQRKCLGKMKDVAGAGRTVVFVSHNMAMVQSLCSRGIYLKGGQLVEDGPVKETLACYASAASDVVDERPLGDREDREGGDRMRATHIEIVDSASNQPLQSVMTGRYMINLRIHRNNHVLDWVSDAGMINVDSGDFYGTGKVPQKSKFGVLVDYQWLPQHADQASPVTADHA
eukprot:g12042.t1